MFNSKSAIVKRMVKLLLF